MVKGKSLEEALKLTNKAVAEALDGLPPVKMHCSVLAEEALRSAISDYYKRLGKDPAEILGCDADCETCHKEMCIRDSRWTAADAWTDADGTAADTHAAYSRRSA